MMKCSLYTATLALPLALAACTVGPNYGGPPTSPATPTGPDFARSGASMMAGPALARWWEPLGDAELTALIDAALAHNPSVEEGLARIREAGAILRQRQAAGLPTVAPSLIGAHVEAPPTSGGAQRTDLTIYNLGATASWEPDLWGADRRNNEAARATVEQRHASLADTQVSLSAQVAQAYVNLRDAQTRTALLASLAEHQRRAMDLTTQRRDAGTATQQDVERAQADLQSTLAQGSPLQAQADVAMNQLAILTGQGPGALDGQLGNLRPIPTLPDQIAIGNPAALIARRPDVRVAERALASATAQIGVNKAKLLPTISFTGILGLGGSHLGDLADPSTVNWGVLPQLKWAGLDWGKGRALVRQSEAQRDASEAQYRSAVLKALEDAESSLSRFGAARKRLAYLAQGEAATQRDEALGAQRFAAGTASGLEQIGRENAHLQARLSLAQANADLTLDFIAVNKALGLGWQE